MPGSPRFPTPFLGRSLAARYRIPAGRNPAPKSLWQGSVCVPLARGAKKGEKFPLRLAARSSALDSAVPTRQSVEDVRLDDLPQTPRAYCFYRFPSFRVWRKGVGMSVWGRWGATMTEDSEPISHLGLWTSPAPRKSRGGPASSTLEAPGLASLGARASPRATGERDVPLPPISDLWRPSPAHPDSHAVRARTRTPWRSPNMAAHWKVRSCLAAVESEHR